MPNIKKEALIDDIAPFKKDEIDELYSNESSMCKIRIKNKKATGFFCKIKDENIPFKKALFTNNHILNEECLKIKEVISLEYLKKIKKIEITENRRVITDRNLDYTCIEIFDSDNIKKFFNIEKIIFDKKDSLKNKEIFILQYALGRELSYSSGKILDIKDNIIMHNASTENGSSGSPLIKRYNNKYVYGIHFGANKVENDNIQNYNLATTFDAIIKDMRAKLSEKKDVIKISNNNCNQKEIEKNNKIIEIEKNNKIIENEICKQNKIIEKKAITQIEKKNREKGKIIKIIENKNNQINLEFTVDNIISKLVRARE